MSYSIIAKVLKMFETEKPITVEELANPYSTEWKLNKLLQLEHAAGLSVGVGIILRDINRVSMEEPQSVSPHARHLAYDWPQAVLFTKHLIQLDIDKTMIDIQSSHDQTAVDLAQMSLRELQLFYHYNILPPQFSEEKLKKKTEDFIAEVQSYNYERLHNRAYKMN